MIYERVLLDQGTGIRPVRCTSSALAIAAIIIGCDFRGPLAYQGSYSSNRLLAYTSSNISTALTIGKYRVRSI